ncbi:helix-turn-helix domain-containing protein [Mucilaginibacter lappiensis]|uniref:helix-turn-helix domain-containing protein n=1 Tax=Mucilaginibacter lappiensis TaxID=354630 RepID=UPI003D2524EE
MEYLKQCAFKKFGILDFCKQNSPDQFIDQLRGFIKIIYIRAGGRVSSDFNDIEVQQDGLLFVSAGQFLRLSENIQGSMIYYNQDLYGVQLHDQEIACDELLFSDFHKIPLVELNANSSAAILSIFDEIRREISQGDINLEEMVRVLLKQIIIRATRFGKHQRGINDLVRQQDSGFSRFFIQLVENNFSKHHDVASYANMLNISAKALNKRICKYRKCTPNEIIKKRIIMEAKRLLVYTHLSVKEIGYRLGYDDPSYFIRFFSKQVKIAPQNFRLHFQRVLNAVA